MSTLTKTALLLAVAWSDLLGVFGLAKKSELDRYKYTCEKLGVMLHDATIDALKIEDKLKALHKVDMSPMQDIHISATSLCGDIYDKYNPGVRGFSAHKAERLAEFVST